jgi:hypothetical protein
MCPDTRCNGERRNVNLAIVSVVVVKWVVVHSSPPSNAHTTPLLSVMHDSISLISRIREQVAQKSLEEREIGTGIPGREFVKTGRAEMECVEHRADVQIRLSPAKMAPAPYIFIR